ncbi:LysE family translocator [Cucumibacter marinus]|uniref:LysE family translocator n=1 Tax=Cucumibacter marinus TaxID=1121252 RepID=UPI000406DB73|nr:LysE family translocator [Cucumibacter marinus]
MIETIAALLIFLFPLAYSPGPGNMVFAATGARFGLRATVPANIGYHLATWLVAALIGLGFLAALDRFPGLFAALNIGGALYVFWIAWRMFGAGTAQKAQSAGPMGFRDGVVLLALNPKAYVIMALMFSQFMAPDTPDTLSRVLVISTVFTLNNLVAFTLWTLIGDTLAAQFRSPRRAKTLNRLFAVTLAGVALWMFFA